MRVVLVCLAILSLSGCIHANYKVLDNVTTPSGYGVHSIKPMQMNKDKGYIDVKVVLFEGYSEYQLKEKREGCFVFDCLLGLDSKTYKTSGTSQTKALSSSSPVYSNIKLVGINFTSDLECKSHSFEPYKVKKIQNNIFRVFIEPKFINDESTLKMKTGVVGFNNTYLNGKGLKKTLPTQSSSVIYDGFCES